MQSDLCTRLCTQAAVGALNFYEGWTAVSQPLPKFDLVAVPGKLGAMENWGLLLFDEFRFLFNHVSSSILVLAFVFLPTRGVHSGMPYGVSNATHRRAPIPAELCASSTRQLCRCNCTTSES